MNINNRQRAYFQTRATLPLEFRREQLKKLSAAIQAREGEILKALHEDLGKSPVEAYTSEIGFVVAEIRHAIRGLPKWMKPRRRKLPLLAWPGCGWTQPEPFGVALIIGPWNYPFQLILSPLVAAIAAGNCACLKPSELAPATARVVGELIRATFDPDYVSVVQGGREVVEELLREKWDHVFFTGSTAVGRLVMEAAARHLTPVTLELGGKSPCIVCSDVPMELAARRIAWGKYLNAGQTCVAPDFVLVDHKVRAEFVEALRKVVREFFGDDPKSSPDYGRVINAAHWERLNEYLNDGTVLLGGGGDVSELYIAPTVLGDVKEGSRVLSEEIFGPILPILGFTDPEEALERVAGMSAPLALYVFTEDEEFQRKVTAETRSGGVCFNDVILHMVGLDFPFGGLGDSGMGAYHGKSGFDRFSHIKTVVRRSLRMDSQIRYAPQKIPLKWLKMVLPYLLGG